MAEYLIMSESQHSPSWTGSERVLATLEYVKTCWHRSLEVYIQGYVGKYRLIFFFFNLILFYIGVQLLYNVMLASGG